MNINRLFEEALNDIPGAEERLFQHLYEMFRIFARQKAVDKDDREDIVQNAIFKVSQAYRQTEIKTSFSTWAHTILRNELTDHFRRVSLKRRKMADLVITGPRYVSPAETDSEFKNRLRKCLRRLYQKNPRQARILTLHYQGYKLAEICEKLGVNPPYFRVLLFRARAALARCLSKGRGGRE